MNNINIMFCGDFSPARKFESIVLDSGADVFGDLLNDIKESDIAFLNLESPLCEEKESVKKTGPSLRADPKCIAAIADAGFSIVGLANNHIMDFGEEGLRETMDACRRYNLDCCGAGFNISDASETVISNNKGVKVGILAAAESEFGIATKIAAGAASFDPISMVERITDARKKCDIVLVTIHCGNEYFCYPRPGLKRLCRFLIDQGADGVIGHHTHVPGVYEFYKGKPIFYSLGNLLFDHSNPPKGWKIGYSVKLTYGVDDKALVSYQVVPYIQSVEAGGIRKLQGKELESFWADLARKCDIFQNEESYTKEWNEYCDSMVPSMLLAQYFPYRFKGIGRLNKVLSLYKFCIGRSSLRTKLNTVRCESHHEVLVNILDKLVEKSK